MNKLDILSEISKFNKDTEVENTDIIKFKICEDDDELNKIVKKYFNKRNLTLKDLYGMLGRTRGYNMYYALVNKRSIKWDTFNKWCDILDIEYDIVIKDKKKEAI